MSSFDATPIDLTAYQKFLDGEAEKQVTSSKTNNGNSIISAAVVGSYSFSWGRIVEQLSGTFFIWKFEISALTSKSDGEKFNAQQQIFSYLHKQYPEQSSEYAILVASLHDLCIFPGIKDDAFIIASPAQHEYKNRIWIHTNILNKEIPEIISNISRYIG